MPAHACGSACFGARGAGERAGVGARRGRDAYGTLRDAYGTLRDAYGTLRDAYGTLRDAHGTLRTAGARLAAGRHNARQRRRSVDPPAPPPPSPPQPPRPSPPAHLPPSSHHAYRLRTCWPPCIRVALPIRDVMSPGSKHLSEALSESRSAPSRLPKRKPKPAWRRSSLGLPLRLRLRPARRRAPPCGAVRPRAVPGGPGSARRESEGGPGRGSR